MFLLTRIIAVMLLSGLLAACGQKGPLFYSPQSVLFSLFPESAAVNPPSTPASSAK